MLKKKNKWQETETHPSGCTRVVQPNAVASVRGGDVRRRQWTSTPPHTWRSDERGSLIKRSTFVGEKKYLRVVLIELSPRLLLPEGTSVHLCIYDRAGYRAGRATAFSVMDSDLVAPSGPHLSRADDEEPHGHRESTIYCLWRGGLPRDWHFALSSIPCLLPTPTTFEMYSLIR